MLKRLAIWSASFLALAAATVAVVYLRDMRRAHDRLSGKSQVIPSPFGDIEYLEGGSGPAVLVVHGSGGGFDRGQLLSASLLGDKFRWIAPSRFGNLRSTFHEGATGGVRRHADGRRHAPDAEFRARRLEDHLSDLA